MKTRKLLFLRLSVMMVILTLGPLVYAQVSNPIDGFTFPADVMTGKMFVFSYSRELENGYKVYN